MARRLAIYHPMGRFELGPNPFGKDVANLQLFRALARHAGLDRLDVLRLRPTTAEQAKAELFEGRTATTEVAVGSILDTAVAAQAGALLRGQPDLYNLAWQRRRSAGDRAYSLLGLVHTIAPPAVRQLIAMASAAPMHPWDAIICTSPSVRQAMERMFADWGEHLAERTGGRPPPAPALPVLPLGVELEAFREQPGERARMRTKLGLGENDVLVLWVGRLSYFEKAFPQPMFAAVQAARSAADARLVFVMAGWFPNEKDRAHFETAARHHAPDVPVVFADGNDKAEVGGLWAAADVFLSLVDNIQETFGITPLEAMAAGLPVVVSDWDGYRATVRHGVEGFLVPTLMPAATGGVGAILAARHVLEGDSYQVYVGGVAQHTAVHIGQAGAVIAELARSPDLRRRMGEAGRARIRDAYDWPVVARAYAGLVDELAALRAAATDPSYRVRADPVKGDPFRDFAHFATTALGLETPLAAAAGATPADVLAVEGIDLDMGFGGFRAGLPACARVLELLLEGRARTVRDVLLAFPIGERRAVELAIGWMAKYGFVDWLT